jgi:hypothetical protein
MDQASVQSYRQLNINRRVSADEILINLDLRSHFLQLARAIAGPVPEEDALRRLVALRKQKKLPRFT